MGLTAGTLDLYLVRQGSLLISRSMVLVIRKVVIVLEELGLAYEPIYLNIEEGQHKAPDYLKINPNGRIPALIDHKNGDFVVWSV